MALFFSFDGIDGVGKSTQLQLFCRWLEEQGEPTVVCRDPGTTPLGERVRELLLNSDHSIAIGPRSEMFLYMAARAQLVDEVIRPALADGRIVVSDRFLLANIVYQGYAGGLDVPALRAVGEVAVTGVKPDCTFLLDMDPVAALERVGRHLDRVERRGAAYREQLRAGFLKEAAHMGDAVHVIRADRSIDAVQAEIRELAGRLLRER
ncbi:MAG TPA: dTMP kinase [Lacipirellula sp.]